MSAVVNRHTDEALLEKMLAPPPLEQARASLEFWIHRRSSLAVYRRRDRREADEMIRRCRARVAAAERAQFGTGLFGLIRRLLALEPPSWPIWQKRTVVALAWAVLPRRAALVAVTALGVVLVSLAALGLGLIFLVLQAA